MIFSINNEKLENYISPWSHKELEIEKLITSTTSKEIPVFNYEIFGEDLLFLDRQKTTNDNKRADIIALDKMGNLVIIELKKDEGKLGVEIQALQYLSAFSIYKGIDFINKFWKSNDVSIIEDFIDETVNLDDLNKHSRIILMARYFDHSLFSMGKWLADQGVSFKCIAYETISIENKKFINFSIAFDHVSSNFKFPLKFISENRTPKNFWHNVGLDDSNWWKYLIQHNYISTSYENEKGDRGEEILKNYIKGDIIYAYISGRGCVGYGIIENTDYNLIEKDSKEDVFPKKGYHLHRKSIRWIETIPDIEKAISSNKLKEQFGISHPIQTSSIIKKGDIEKLKVQISELAHSS